MTQQEIAFDNPELAKRDQGIAIAEATNERLVDWLRARMVELYRARVTSHGEAACVTADDARRRVEIAFELGSFERPSSMNFMGSVFRKGWKKTGQTIKSETSGSHGNELDCWVYVGN